MFKYKIYIRKNDSNYVKLPLAVVFLIVITVISLLRLNGLRAIDIALSVIFWFTVTGFVLALVTGCEILISSKQYADEVRIIKKDQNDESDIIEKEYQVTEEKDGTIGIEVDE